MCNSTFWAWHLSLIWMLKSIWCRTVLKWSLFGIPDCLIYLFNRINRLSETAISISYGYLLFYCAWSNAEESNPLFAFLQELDFLWCIIDTRLACYGYSIGSEKNWIELALNQKRTIHTWFVVPLSFFSIFKCFIFPNRFVSFLYSESN